MAGRIENLKPWKPGQSGNPGGRPKKLLVDQSLEELLLADDSKLAKDIALALIGRATIGDVRAAQLIAERTQGKPIQGIGVAGDLGFRTTLLERLERAAEGLSDGELQDRIDTLTSELQPKLEKK